MQELQKYKNNPAEAQNLSEDDRFLMEMSPEEEDQYVLDKLFIESGEDVEDLMVAFKYHKLI